MSKNSKPVYIVGDIHGQFNYFRIKVEKNDLRDCVLVGLGDIGFGFNSLKNDMIVATNLNKLFEDRNIRFLAFRGNHDDPARFDGSIKLSNLHLVPDYHKEELNGEKWMFVGGGISIDRILRLEGRNWWEDEKIVLDTSRIESCDVLAIHVCPSYFNHFGNDGIVKSFSDRDSGLWEELVEERMIVNEIVRLGKPKRIYYGHFHNSRSESSPKHGIDLARCVDELEFLEVKPLQKEETL